MVSANNPQLSADGQYQAEALGEGLSTIAIGLVITSPKDRCVQTAERILRHQLAEPELVADSRLLELGFGPFEGLTVEEIDNKGLGDVFRAWRQGDDPAFPEGMETFAAAAARLSPVYDMATAGDHPCVAIVGHSHALRILIATRVLSVGPEAHRRMRMDHAKVAEIQWEGTTPRLVGLNQFGVSS